MRVGHGYDVHRLKAGRKLIIGGVEVPHTTGLDGHSDADVLIHAVMDALIGAAAMGDIGKLFPDTDDAYLDIDSTVLLREVYHKLEATGYRICNIDSTIIAQRPKLAAFIPKMKERIAEVLCLDPDQVNVKATTEEHLGFTGAEEGIAAHAVCLIEKK